LEPIIRDIIKVIPDSWYMKIQVNPMAHTKTTGDFLFLTDNFRYIIECKEQKTTSFPFSRLTQHNALLEFHNASWANIGLVVICFWKGTKKKSSFYLLDIVDMDILIKNSTKKSVNEKDLIKFKVDLDQITYQFR